MPSFYQKLSTHLLIILDLPDVKKDTIFGAARIFFCPSYFMTTLVYFSKVVTTFVTGKSFSEALILASTNPQYDKRLFMELP